MGGTGCQVARIAARMLYDMRRSRMHTPQMVLIDPDRIEEKNVGRQGMFVPAEIGEYKAAAIGRRLNLALGLDIAWITEPVNADKHFDRSGSLVISCVDNHLARRELSAGGRLPYLSGKRPVWRPGLYRRTAWIGTRCGGTLMGAMANMPTCRTKACCSRSCSNRNRKFLNQCLPSPVPSLAAR